MHCSYLLYYQLYSVSCCQQTWGAVQRMQVKAVASLAVFVLGLTLTGSAVA